MLVGLAQKILMQNGAVKTNKYKMFVKNQSMKSIYTSANFVWAVTAFDYCLKISVECGGH